MDPGAEAPRQREPIFQAPWPAMTLAVFILACFGLQLWLGADRTVTAWGFSPAGLANGKAATLVTAIFLHGGWGHVLANTAFILAFGAPVSRKMGTGPAGALAYLLFFLLCGVIGNLVFGALHPKEVEPLVGASGAGSGLMAAASLLLTPGRRLAPLFSRPVLVMAGAFLIGNVVIAFTGWAPGAGGAQVAWEAHLGGYAAGLILFAPTLLLLRRL